MASGTSEGVGGAKGPLVVREASVVRVVGQLPWWATVVGLLCVFATHYSAPLAALLVALQVAIMGRWQLRRRDKRARPGALTVDDRGILLGRELLLHRADVKDALRVPAPVGEGERVTLRVVDARGDGFEATVENADDAWALLRRLGKDVSRTTVTYRGVVKDRTEARKRWRLIGPLDVLIVSVIALFIGLIAYAALGHPSPWMPVPVAVGIMTLALSYEAFTILRKCDVTVGTDGVSIGAAKAARFLPWDRITSVTRDENDVTLTLVDSGTLVFTPHSPTKDGYAAASFVQRTAEAKKTKRGTKLRVDLTPLLGRGGRGADEWVRAVEEVSSGSSGYRVAAVARDELWRVALDPAADGEMRTGAVLALRPGLDDEERARLRRAAQRCAAPKLRALMDRVLEGDDAGLRELLEDGEDPAPETRAQAR